jgi:hypothetical protein
MALTTFPAFKHLVQTYSLRFLPSTKIDTFWRLGIKSRLVCCMECDTLMPTTGFFPHIKQRLAIVLSYLILKYNILIVKGYAAESITNFDSIC